MGVMSLSLTSGRTYILRVFENSLRGRKCSLNVAEVSALPRAGLLQILGILGWQNEGDWSW
jgi:hypothetical protein